jgi:hypothetical protein
MKAYFAPAVPIRLPDPSKNWSGNQNFGPASPVHTSCIPLKAQGWHIPGSASAPAPAAAARPAPSVPARPAPIRQPRPAAGARPRSIRPTASDPAPALAIPQRETTPALVAA